MATNLRKNFANGSAGFKANMFGHYGHGGQANGANPYNVHRGLPMSPPSAQHGLPTLTSNMAAMTVNNGYSAAHNAKNGIATSSANPIDYNGLAMSGTQGLWVPDMSSVYGIMTGAGQQSNLGHSPGMYGQSGAYVPQGTYHYGHGVVDNSPLPGTWGSRVSSADMPPLLTPRRDSVSSNENDVPGTPYHSAGLYHYGHSAAILDRSPNGVYTSSATPSPSQLAQYQMLHSLQKQQAQSTISPQLLQLLNQEPQIPRAIPAPSSPLKPLDRSLENKTGETNVYIRGLQPETSDEMLYTWGKRFGDVQSSKSILDNKSGLCKGFGFVKYHNFEDAEDCIRGFHYLGYEVSFARESFYSKLKKFADENNTNLYVSNIPKNMNEHELASIFAPHKVCSSRILRDLNGTGRGVGFARFETRDICDEVIKTFSNTPVAKPGGEEHLIQIRFSDTSEQKLLKQQTAAGRVFRAAEYEAGVAQARAMRAVPDRYASISPERQSSLNEFEVYLHQGQANAGAHGSSSMPYRQPWAPATPSGLGVSRSGVTAGLYEPVAHVEAGAAEHPVETKTVPATPVKDDETVSPSCRAEHET